MRVPGAVGREGRRRKRLRPGRGEPAQVSGFRGGERKTSTTEIKIISERQKTNTYIHNVIIGYCSTRPRYFHPFYGRGLDFA